MKRQNTESGRTMLEMLGVLAIMGVIMYGAIAGIGFGVDMFKVNAAYNQLEDLSQGITDLYSWTAKYPTGNKIRVAVCENNVVDCTSTKEIDLKVGTGVTIEQRNENTYEGVGFTITVSGLSDLACSRLKNQTYSNLRPPTAGPTPRNCDCEENGSGATNTLTFIDK